MQAPVAPVAAGRRRKPMPANPYRSLDAFGEADTDMFFGRDREVAELHEMFAALHTPAAALRGATRLLALLGPSGSGKSSLLRAGLVAELDRRPVRASAARAVVLSPGRDPLFNLAQALAGLEATDTGADSAERARLANEYHAMLRQSEDGRSPGLARVAALLPNGRRRGLIVVVDQLEELYTLAQPEDRSRLIANLVEAASEPDGPVSALVAFRSDFLERTMSDPGLNTLLTGRDTTYLVPMIGEEGLRDAIQRPARERGHPFAPALVDLLVRETSGEEGSLPALQYTLTQLWDAMSEKDPAERLRELGGVVGALAARGEELLATLDEHQKEIARRVFLATVQLGEGSRDTRRRAAVREVTGEDESREEILSVLRLFAGSGARLVTIQGSDQVEFTVAHEALFSHWRTLGKWSADYRSDLRFHRRLAEAADRWDRAGRRYDVLWHGADLAQLVEFRRKKAIPLTAVQSNFAKASLRRRQRDRALAAAAVAALAVLALALARSNYLAWVEIRPWGKLVDLSNSGHWDLAGRVVSIGRDSPGTDGFPPDVSFPKQTVSRAHLELHRDGMLLDMRSTYGTTHNGHFVNYAEAQPFADGDLLVLGGDTALQYHSYSYVWYDWMASLFAWVPPRLDTAKPNATNPVCAWGAVVGEVGGRPAVLYLKAPSQGIRVSQDAFALAESDDPSATLVVELLSGKHGLLPVALDGIADIVALDDTTTKRSDLDRTIVVRLNPTAIAFQIELRPNPYDIGMIDVPAGTAIVAAMPHNPAEKRYQVLTAQNLAFAFEGGRLQTVAFTASDGTPLCPMPVVPADEPR